MFEFVWSLTLQPIVQSVGNATSAAFRRTVVIMISILHKQIMKYMQLF